MGVVAYDVREHERPPEVLIVIGIPTLGMVHIQLMYHCMALTHPVNAKVRYLSTVGTGTGHGRNEIVAHALRVGASHVFFVDDDTWPPAHALVRLLDDHRPIVSGLYFAKVSSPQPLVLHGAYTGTAKSWRPGELVECYAHGMGCTLIQIGVFRDLYERGFVETDPAMPCTFCGGVGCKGCVQTGHMVRWFYATRTSIVDAAGYQGHQHQTEDVYFLERAAKAGYQPTVDTGVFAWHYDHTDGKVYPLKQYQEWRTTGTITWETDEGPVVWSGMGPDA